MYLSNCIRNDNQDSLTFYDLPSFRVSFDNISTEKKKRKKKKKGTTYYLSYFVTRIAHELATCNV